MLFFVKVRIDSNKLAELGAKLQTGELDTSHIVHTHCFREDPAVGMSIWEVEDFATLENELKPFQPYYAETMEIIPVVTTNEAQIMLMEAS